ncbi:MAG: hypothetical protein D6688_11110 [Alphaproteobacteria bacterium]|nr:MAG: hypothetical protein D6688_11110 [Alphaproteobacteria bacterium]
MKKFLLISVTASILTAIIGYFLGVFLLPPKGRSAGSQAEVAASHSERLYKLPLGRFTFQTYAPNKERHYVAEMDVLIAGAADFERINGADGKNRLRDAVIAVTADLAESPNWEDLASSPEHDDLEAEITSRLSARFPMVRKTKVLSFIASDQD